MDENGFDAQRIGDQASMLATGRPKAVQDISGDVIAAFDRDFLDRVGHVLNRDADEAVGDIFGGALRANLSRNRLKTAAAGVGIDGLIAAVSKQCREMPGGEFAGCDVGIGDGERSAAPVASRAWIGTSAFGSNAHAGAIKGQYRTAACRNRVDI